MPLSTNPPQPRQPMGARPVRPPRQLPRQTQVRPWREDDTAALARFYQALGQDTLRRRFHCAFNGLSPARVQALTALGGANPQQVQTVVAACGPAPGAEVLAHAGWHLDGPGQAEFALVVADGWQGLGLGERLMAALVPSAARVGVQQLHATVLSDNAAMLGMLQRIGLHTAAHPDDPNLVCVALQVSGWPALRRQTAAQRTWRACGHTGRQLAALVRACTGRRANLSAGQPQQAVR